MLKTQKQNKKDILIKNIENIKKICYDCNEEIKIKDGKIINGMLLKYKVDKENEWYIYKCNKCFKKDPSYRQKCEVYSRVVGYIRPVQQWHLGNKEEFKDRKTFKIKEDSLKDEKNKKTE